MALEGGGRRALATLTKAWSTDGADFRKYWEASAEANRIKVLVTARDMLIERLSSGAKSRGKLFFLLCPELADSKIERIAAPSVVPKLLEIRVDVSRCVRLRSCAYCGFYSLVFVRPVESRSLP